jgi:hypothetical protein
MLSRIIVHLARRMLRANSRSAIWCGCAPLTPRHLLGAEKKVWVRSHSNGFHLCGSGATTLEIRVVWEPCYLSGVAVRMVSLLPQWKFGFVWDHCYHSVWIQLYGSGTPIQMIWDLVGAGQRERKI